METVRIREILFHHSLYVRGSHCLQPREIGIDARRIAKQHRRFSERQSFAVTRLEFAELIRNELVFRFL